MSTWEGNLIKMLRKNKKLTQKEFSEWLEIPKRTIEDWESGKRKPPMYLIKLIQFKCEKCYYTTHGVL